MDDEYREEWNAEMKEANKITNEAKETLDRYEAERKNEVAAYKKQQKQQLKAQCLMSAIETVKRNIDLDVLTEAKKYYEWIRR